MLTRLPRAARLFCALALAASPALLAPSVQAAHGHRAHHAARRSIGRLGCSVKSRKICRSAPARSARSASATALAVSLASALPAATTSPRRPTPAPPGGGSGKGSYGGGEAFGEPPVEGAEEPATEAANQPSELEGEPSGEGAEEGEEGEEGASESGEGPEPGEEIPSGQRKYAGELPSDSGETVTDPIDPRFLGYVPFGTISFWIQHWRAYMDTWPASRLLGAVGINFSGNGTGADAVAQLLQDSGFRLARKGIPWDAMSYTDPTSLRSPSKIGAALAILHRHGLRPLIVLDANSTAPTPLRNVKLETLANALEGSRTVKLSHASAALVVPGKTGFSNLAFGGSPDILVTSVLPDGTATLSRALPRALPAGAHPGATLRFAPFSNPVLPNGEPNPAFRETMNGWLSYVGAVCREAAGVVGPGGFDLEIWNELSFGSEFLNIEHYEAAFSANKAHKHAVNKAIRRALLRETVAYVRNPANGISRAVGITDGFASESPFASGANAPSGLTALSKHPYTGAKILPAAFQQHRNSPIDALGNRDAPRHVFTPAFIPSYQSMFPEYTISGVWTESLIRDVAPFTTYVYGYPHGRYVAPPGGEPVQKWITEFNMSPWRGVPMSPDGVTPVPGATRSQADRAHFQAKALLRDLVAMVGKGISRDYFFHAGLRGGALDVIGQDFLAALEAHPESYPGDSAGGETMTGFKNMLGRFQGPGPGGPARQLQLLSIVQQGNHAQFAGDETAAHPALYDRDVLAVLPFQSSPTRFVIPVYVMTRDLMTLYRPSADPTDVTRYDLPDERFQITLGNLPESSRTPTVSAYDPLRDATTPARLVSREGTRGVFELAATDYPRILAIDYGA